MLVPQYHALAAVVPVVRDNNDYYTYLDPEPTNGSSRGKVGSIALGTGSARNLFSIYPHYLVGW